MTEIFNLFSSDYENDIDGHVYSHAFCLSGVDLEANFLGYCRQYVTVAVTVNMALGENGYVIGEAGIL